MTRAQSIRLAAAAVAAVAIAACGTTSHVRSRAATAALSGGPGTDPSYRGPQSEHHGPVQAAPRIVLVYWGQVWRTGSFQRQVRSAERAMLAKLPDSAWARILSQYGVLTGPRLAATIIQSGAPGAASVSYREIQADLVKASQATHIQPGLDVTWIVFPPPTADLRGFKNECGEHDDWRHNGRQYVYALVQPFDTSTFGTGSASCVEYDGYGGSMVAATTSLTSHEIAEAATDPLSIANGNGTGWWGDAAARRFGMGASEIGDYCYAQAIQPWGSSGPTVQASWSQRNAGSGENRGCVASVAGGKPQIVGQGLAVSPGGQTRPLPAVSPAARRRLSNS